MRASGFFHLAVKRYDERQFNIQNRWTSRHESYAV
jgi:hypothetical protein